MSDAQEPGGSRLSDDGPKIRHYPPREAIADFLILIVILTVGLTLHEVVWGEDDVDPMARTCDNAITNAEDALFTYYTDNDIPVRDDVLDEIELLVDDLKELCTDG